jgi:hypothetical protein
MTLDALANLIRSDAAVSGLEQALATAGGLIAEHEATHDAAETFYQQGLAEADDKEIAKRDAARAKARRDLDRARALSEAAEAKLAEARQAAALDAAKRRQRELTKASADISRRLKMEYVEHATAISRLIADLERVKAQVALFNDDLPDDLQPIPDPERTVRHIPPATEALLDDKQVSLWIEIGGTRTFAQDDPKVQVSERDPTRGSRSGDYGGELVHRLAATQVKLVRYRRIRWQKPAAVPHLEPLVTQIRLPGLLSTDGRILPQSADWREDPPAVEEALIPISDDGSPDSWHGEERIRSLQRQFPDLAD